MLLESKYHAIGHAHGTEDAPSRKKPDLPRRQQFFGRFSNLVIMQNKAMHSLPF
jgi:hypothetical protein